MAAEPNAKSSSHRGSITLRDILAPITAFVLLLAFVVFIVYLLGLTTTQETQWTRAVYLFSGAEAIAFAAAGFFFGSEIQRKRAEQAEERVGEAEKLVTETDKVAIKAATNGRALKEALLSKLEIRAGTIEAHISGEHYGGLGEEKDPLCQELKNKKLVNG